jgi:hypothetical protein
MPRWMGTWYRTTILLTTDHSFRASKALDGKADHRIPFLLKMAGHDEEGELSEPFTTVLTGDLLVAVLRGEVSTPVQAEDWIQSTEPLRIIRTITECP